MTGDTRALLSSAGKGELDFLRLEVMEVTTLKARCEDKLWSELASIAHDEGLELYDIEPFGSGGLRIFVQPLKGAGETVDSAAQGGISLDDCSRLCRRLMVFFEAEAGRFGLPTEPVIEVSSPGVNRALKYREHFGGAVGERVKVTLDEPATVADKLAGTVCGVLRQAQDDGITVLEEKSNIDISMPYHAIRKVRIDFQFT